MMSPWLLNMYMDGVVREVNASAPGRGVQLLGRGKSLESESAILCGWHWIYLEFKRETPSATE